MDATELQLLHTTEILLSPYFSGSNILERVVIHWQFVMRCEGMLIGRLLAQTCGSGCITPLGGPTAKALRREQWQNLVSQRVILSRAYKQLYTRIGHGEYIVLLGGINMDKRLTTQYMLDYDWN